MNSPAEKFHSGNQIRHVHIPGENQTNAIPTQTDCAIQEKNMALPTGLATNNLKMSKWLEETTPAEPDLFFSSNWNWTLVNPLSTNKVKTGRQSYVKLSRPLHPLQTGQAGILRTCDRV